MFRNINKWNHRHQIRNKREEEKDERQKIFALLQCIDCSYVWHGECQRIPGHDLGIRAFHEVGKQGDSHIIGRDCSKIVGEEIRRFASIVRDYFCNCRQERNRRENQGVVHLAIIHDY